MRLIQLFLIASLLTIPSTPLLASDDLLNAGRASSIDFLLDNAIRRGLISGGVVAIGNHKGILYGTARGSLFQTPGSPALSERTLFDIASLTKVIATTPAVMKLLEAGRINLLDPITRWFPELEGSGREEITLLNLLTHTSGIDDMEIPADDSLKKALIKTAAQNSPPPGDRFRYADINFILLGEMVQRVSGLSLDRFCSEQVFAPLGMADTQFLPQADLAALIAPTAGVNRALSSGIVQDMNARRLGGVAGHAGLFSNVSDLTRFAGMILNQGSYKGVKLFDERTVAQMTAPYFYSKGRIIRGLGWDINSPFSAPKGNHFSAMSFGHTGYSGSSMWIDPEQDLFVVMLTIRLDYQDVRQFSRLRSDISTMAVSIFSNPRMADEISNSSQQP
ncbi:MAG: serine hydrolase domain-containing protein [Geobacteraceae bacterium]|nr:serine hydrolase domain-containing protein [Geobacteraceae bacterium]